MAEPARLELRKIETAAPAVIHFVSDLDSLKRLIERTLREKLVFKADAELVPEGRLLRFEAKTRLIKKRYEERLKQRRTSLRRLSLLIALSCNEYLSLRNRPAIM